MNAEEGRTSLYPPAAHQVTGGAQTVGATATDSHGAKMAKIPKKTLVLPATDGSPRHGDYQIGSEKSRAADTLAG
jgi:hypothetical protein